MPEQVNMVIIGCGDVTRKRHARLCRQAENVQLFGFCNRTRSRAEEMAAEYGGQVFDSVEDVLACPQVDAVLVATTEGTHDEISIRALKAGKHVLCEKPMAASLAGAGQMISAAKENGKKLMINFNQRFYMAHQKMKQLIQAGEIGRVVAFQTEYETRGQDLQPDGEKDDAFYDKVGHAHGVLSQIGSHKIDLMSYLIGDRAEEVLLTSATQVKTFSDGTPVPYEDQAVLNLRYRKGAIGIIHTSWVDFSDNRRTVIYGTEGTLAVGEEPDIVLLYRKNGEKVTYGSVKQRPVPYREPLTPIVERFAECILSDTEPLVTGEDGLYSMQVLDAAYRSAKEKRWIKIR